MTDYYTKRLTQNRGEQEARLDSVLPLRKPMREERQEQETLASKPKAVSLNDPWGEIEDEGWRGEFTRFSEGNERFGDQMRGFEAQMLALRERCKDLGLPREVMEDQVKEIVGNFALEARAEDELEAQMQQSGFGAPMMLQQGNPIGGVPNAYL